VLGNTSLEHADILWLPTFLCSFCFEMGFNSSPTYETNKLTFLKVFLLLLPSVGIVYLLINIVKLMCYGTEMIKKCM
jgi:hypothetical protein